MYPQPLWHLWPRMKAVDQTKGNILVNANNNSLRLIIEFNLFLLTCLKICLNHPDPPGLGRKRIGVEYHQDQQ